MPSRAVIPADRMTQIIELFKRFGYRSPSMLDIATQLAISKKTLYTYAINKEELIRKSIAVVKQNYDEHELGVKYFNQPQQLIYERWFQILIDFHQDFSIYARQDLSNFYPYAEQDYLQFHQELLTGFVSCLSQQNTSMLIFAVKTIDRQIQEIVHESFQMNGKTKQVLLKEANLYNWQAIQGLMNQ